MEDRERLEQLEKRVRRVEEAFERIEGRLDRIEHLEIGRVPDHPVTRRSSVEPEMERVEVAPRSQSEPKPPHEDRPQADALEMEAVPEAPEKPEPEETSREKREAEHRRKVAAFLSEELAAAAKARREVPRAASEKPVARTQPRDDSRIEALLKKLHLRPPSPRDSAEVEIVAWWATRIGALLGVIAAVFLAVYVSRDIPAWVHFAELAAMSLGVTFLGLWIEKRVREYGAVLFGMGLALIYFTAFAAYAIPPVRVIHSPGPASALQYAAVVAIAVCALWRNSELIAIMAVFLGYVSCGFALVEEMVTFALMAGLLLAVVASVLHVVRKWKHPFEIAVTLVYVLYAFLLSRYWIVEKQAPLPFWSCMAWLALTHVTLAIGDYVAVQRGRALEPRRRRVVMPFNSTAAALLAFLTAHYFYGAQLAEMYFLFGVLFLAGAVIWYLRQPGEMMVQAYFLKASALISLGMIEVFDDRTQWIALGIQSAVLVIAARQWRFPVARPLVLATWIASLGFLFIDVDGRKMQPDLLSATGLLELGYLVLSSAVLTAYHKWTAKPDTDRLLSAREAVAALSRHAAVLCLVVLGFASIALVRRHVAAYHVPAAFIAATVALTLGSSVLRSCTGLVAAIVTLVAAHVACWGIEPRAIGITSDHLWWQVIAVCGFTIAAIIANEFLTRRSKGSGRSGAQWGAAVLHLLWVFTLLEGLAETYRTPVGVVVGCFLTLGFGLLAAWTPIHVLPRVAAFGVILTPLALGAGRVGGDPLVPVGAVWCDWLGFAAAIGFVILTRAWPRLRQRFADPEDDRFVPPAEWLHAIVLVIPAFFAFRHVDLETHRMVVWSIAAPAGLALLAWPRLRTSVLSATIFLVMAHTVFHIDIAHGAALTVLNVLEKTPVGYAIVESEPFGWVTLGYSVVAGMFTLACALMLRRLPWPWSRGSRQVFEWGYALAALAMVFTALALPDGPVAGYTTALWGVWAVFMLGSGFVLGVKPVRIVGLIGLALCIPRAFVIDITAMLHRIVAFMGISAVLLAVGFLYTRYGYLIQRFDEAPEDGEKAR